MRAVAVLFAALLLSVASCGEKESADDAAARAAKTYYEHLMSGRYEEFLAGVSGTDSLPAAYREQLLTNVRQFAGQQKTEHGGICGVDIASFKVDSVAGYTNVFLIVTFGDSLREEVAVPMVESGGRWLMK